MSRRRAPDRGPRRGAALLPVLLAAILGGLAAVPAAGADPLTRSLEVGSGWSHYTGGLGDANAQFLRCGLSRPDRFALRLEFGRERRFDEESFGVGLGASRTLDGTTFALGWSTGTGDFIAHRYRLDASVMRPLGGVLTTLGYTRIQSKADNRSDGLGLGLVRYVGHWIVSASGRVDWGYPGSTTSASGGGGLTWFVWKKTYLGVGYDAGKVSYQLVGPGEALVDYRTKGFNFGWSQWFTAKSGLNLRLDYGDTPFYTVRGGSLSFFTEW